MPLVLFPQDGVKTSVSSFNKNAQNASVIDHHEQTIAHIP
jgi:hypothetical protein